MSAGKGQAPEAGGLTASLLRGTVQLVFATPSDTSVTLGALLNGKETRRLSVLVGCDPLVRALGYNVVQAGPRSSRVELSLEMVGSFSAEPDEPTDKFGRRVG